MTLNTGKFVPLFAALAVSLTVTSAYSADNNSATWDQDKAAKYLDEREKAWFEFQGADRGEGVNKTTCISCHSVVPFAVARPALRKLAAVSQPTEHEQKILDRTRKRVAHWKELDSPRFRLFYDFDEPKKKESWGTEAVLNVLILAFDDQNQGRKTPSDSANQAFVNLWQVQVKDGEKKGSWDWLDFGLEPWESGNARYFGSALAAIAVGTAPGGYTAAASPRRTPGEPSEGDKGVTLLREYLRKHLPEQNLNNRIWVLWASAKLDGVLGKEEQKEIIDQVLAKQQEDGGWRLSSLGGRPALAPSGGPDTGFKRIQNPPLDTASDGYATGLILHVLKTAGVAKDHPQVSRGLNWLRANQKPSGAWAGISLNKKRDPESTDPGKAHVGKFMWDAATAFAVLALAEE
jgi:squalene-hopene/tetraprenyl-beta-curcumene cyclase